MPLCFDCSFKVRSCVSRTTTFTIGLNFPRSNSSTISGDKVEGLVGTFFRHSVNLLFFSLWRLSFATTALMCKGTRHTRNMENNLRVADLPVSIDVVDDKRSIWDTGAQESFRSTHHSDLGFAYVVPLMWLTKPMS